MASLSPWDTEVVNPEGRIDAEHYQRLSTDVGKTYRLTAQVSATLPKDRVRAGRDGKVNFSVADRAAAILKVGTTPGAGDIYTSPRSPNARGLTMEFVALAEVAYITAVVSTSKAGGFAVFTNIEVEELQP